jgi:hypothetical protein
MSDASLSRPTESLEEKIEEKIEQKADRPGSHRE